MRWSIIRLIWLRELRDQLRDRRTLFMIAGLPLLLYPVLGSAVLGFALGFSDRPSVIGVARSAGLPEDFPPRDSAGAGRSPLPLADRHAAARRRAVWRGRHRYAGMGKPGAVRLPAADRVRAIHG